MPGSLMIVADMDLVMVSRALGHSDIQVTADIYGPIDAETLRAETEKFGQVLRLAAANTGPKSDQTAEETSGASPP